MISKYSTDHEIKVITAFKFMFTKFDVLGTI